MHEEDYGLLWKHWDFRNERHRGAPLAPARDLVDRRPIGNYDYGFFWYLYQDGTIEAEVKATGIMSTRLRCRRARRRATARSSRRG